MGLLLLPLLAHAVNDTTYGKITTILTSHANFGQCMVLVPQFVSPANDCPPQWVSLDCSGDFYPKEQSRRLLETAQMSYALELYVKVYFTDTKKHNGYCVATRVDTFR